MVLLFEFQPSAHAVTCDTLTRMDAALLLGAFAVGGIVGLTGMGGGALMTPMLVLFFGVSPLTAVSSDLVASAVMKPVGSAVHLRRGTVNLSLVGWLCAGSIPAAFLGVLALKLAGDEEGVQHAVKTALGVAILLTASLLILRAYLRLMARTHPGSAQSETKLRVRPVPTLLLGVLGGFVVGMTSVGSGSLIIIGLMFMYPALKAKELVGTDLLQAVPLVGAAAGAHLLFGDFDLAVSVPLILGSLPGVYLGARLSTALPGGIVRRALALVLVASGLKLLEVSNVVIGLVLLGLVVLGSLLWMQVRRRHGLPALASVETKQRRKTSARQ